MFFYVVTFKKTQFPQRPSLGVAVPGLVPFLRGLGPRPGSPAAGDQQAAGAAANAGARDIPADWDK